MAIQDFKLAPGEQLFISVNKKSSDESRDFQAHELQHAINTINRPDEVLKRRLIKEGYLNFYDMGLYQQSPGNYVDIPDLTVAQSYTLAPLAINRLSLAEFQPLVNKILSFTADKDWKDVYKKISQLEIAKYRIEFTHEYLSFINNLSVLRPDDPGWETGKGLNLNKSQIKLLGADIKKVGVRANNAFMGFSTDKDGQNNESKLYKITEEFNYNSSEVTLDLTKDTDIFLMPNFGKFIIESRGSYATYLFSYIMTLNREFFLDLDTEFVFQIVQALNGSLYTFFERAVGGGIVEYFYLTSQQFSDFEYYIKNNIPIVYSNFEDHGWYIIGWSSYGDVRPGTLTAVFIQGAKKYYCWTEEVVNEVGLQAYLDVIFDNRHMIGGDQQN